MLLLADSIGANLLAFPCSVCLGLYAYCMSYIGCVKDVPGCLAEADLSGEDGETAVKTTKRKQCKVGQNPMNIDNTGFRSFCDKPYTV